jgi:hypothetical protein
MALPAKAADCHAGGICSILRSARGQDHPRAAYRRVLLRRATQPPHHNPSLEIMMSEHDQKKDPWADLAESLGAKPAAKPGEEPTPRPVATTPPSARPPQKPRVDRPATPAAQSDWGGLASSLGLEPAKEPPATPPPSRPQPPAAPRDAVEPPPRRSDREHDEFSFGNRRPPAESSPQQRRDDVRPQRREAVESAGTPRPEASGTPRPEAYGTPRPEAADTSRPLGERSEAGPRDRGESGAAPPDGRNDEQGEGRGRRRRGRRGGRGRGRRDEGREEGRDRPLPGRLDDEQATDRWPADAENLDGANESRDGRLNGPTDRVGQQGETAGNDDGGRRQEPAADGDRDADGAPRRRRRRGRRGGRRRGRGDREDGGVGVRPQADRDGSEPPRDGGEGSARLADHDADDEPLPVGYGGRSPGRQTGDSGRSETSRREGGEPSSASKSEDREPGESGGRRRRRRRRGEGRSRDSRGSAAPAEGGREPRRSSDASARSGRRSRRSTSDERRSASTFDRGRRDEFAPVAGGREEDDEGLEFLGVEDVGHDGHGRDDRHPVDDDDSIIESGLNEVLDVPSWVEAIGIVIAGNLDARSRSPRGGDSGRSGASEGRSGASEGRGSSSDRPRDARRGGRSGGDQR